MGLSVEYRGAIQGCCECSITEDMIPRWIGIVVIVLIHRYIDSCVL